MLLPNIFRNDGLLKGFNGFMDWPAGMTTTTDGALMKSDVKDAGDHYEVLMDLPGFKKEDVKLQLKDGILSFEATKKTENDEKDENGKFIRRERFLGTCTRSFYVGENLEQDDIRAKFENGVLKVDVPKKEPTPAIKTNRYIAIE